MRVCILGSGAYGSALATILNENHNEVVMWTKFEQEAGEMQKTRICPKLPGVKLDENIEITSDLYTACLKADFILLAIPTAFTRDVLEQAKSYIDGKPLCIASKGIEQNSCQFVSDIAETLLPNSQIAAISGPSFAVDVIDKVPVGLSLACKDSQVSHMIATAFCNSHFKLRPCTDVIGTEICGAIKNVIAIAAGILDGMGMPESTSAMFITESIHDIKELIKALGGEGNTILSFAGFGDLLLTATSSKSRNFSFGKLIGKGASLIILKQLLLKDYIP